MGRKKKRRQKKRKNREKGVHKYKKMGWRKENPPLGNWKKRERWSVKEIMWETNCQDGIERYRKEYEKAKAKKEKWW